MRILSEQEKRQKREAAKSAKKFAELKAALAALPEAERAKKQEGIERELGISIEDLLRYCEAGVQRLRAGLPEEPLPPELRDRIREHPSVQRARRRSI